MSQTYTSARTSMNAARRPKVYGQIPVPVPGSVLFDYGCGKYTDHVAASLPGVEYLAYDPYNKPDDVNARSIKRLRAAMDSRSPVTVVCSNVLNVIDDDHEVRKIARDIMTIVLRTGGTGYVTVYAGNRSGVGRQTGPDQYQRNQRLEDYAWQFFRGGPDMAWQGKWYTAAATIEHGMIVIRCLEVQKHA